VFNLYFTFCFSAGLGYILNPDFSFVKIAAPYAQVQNNPWPVTFLFYVKI